MHGLTVPSVLPWKEAQFFYEASHSSLVWQCKIGRTSEHFIITAHLDISLLTSIKIHLCVDGDMSPPRVNTALQHICSEACTKIQLCAALQHTSSLAYLDYCEIPSCASADAVLKKV